MEKKRKNVLIITHYFWPEDFKINELAQGLSKDYDVSILTGFPSYPSKSYFKNFNKKKLKNLDIIRVPIYRRDKSNISIFLNYLTYLFSLPIFGMYLLRKKKFDFIFVYQPSPITVGLTGILFKYYKRCKVALWINDLWPDTIDHVNSFLLRRTKFIFKLITNFIYSHSDYILIQSKSFKKKIKTEYRKKISFFPNWIDTTNYKNIKLEKKHKSILETKLLKLMYIGNIGYSQDFYGILKILNILKKKGLKICFIVIGEGRDKDYIINEVKKKNLHNYILFFGRIKKELIKNYSNHTDLLFLSLRKNKLFEITIPAKLQTYLSLKKPIFGLISGETSNLIKSLKCGISVNSGNYNSAANKIEKIIRNKKLLNNFSGKKTNNLQKKYKYQNIISFLKKIIG
jgi:colanic acid biosynthesis glycosyl transferase WcaI